MDRGLAVGEKFTRGSCELCLSAGFGYGGGRNVASKGELGGFVFGFSFD